MAYWYLIPISFFALYVLIAIFVEKRLLRILHKGNAYNYKNYNLQYSGIFRELDEMVRTYSILLTKEREGLKEYYDKFNAIFDTMGAGILVFDNEAILQKTNLKAREIFHSVTLKYGMPLSKILIKSGIKIPAITGIYDVYSKKLKKNLQIIVSKKNNFIILVINDITDYKKMKKTLEDSRHFARLGEILADASHGLKTPIARLKMVFQMYEITKDEKYLKKLENEINNIQNIIKETLELFKMEEVIEEININKIIKDTLKIFQNTYPEITFTIKEKADIYIQSDIALFKSAVANIIQNSVDAVLMKKSKKNITVGIYEKKDGYKLLFCDNGIGMTEEEKARFLKPFFTTKENGTGLGSIFLERFIIFQNAQLSVNSLKGRGTIIKLFFLKK
ncbi:histidine kinase [Marinitoga piezophila KA3]|uniref:histidine kinase n=1 Tax=Marinitoga piezophila (strain DSM 14283 / JCM 11233 / KA3) TaxID=443254 RepID=H2J8D5_MARPK|nr:HAMP domain-containing sensor histidine kinase [Marinitoga piezophila]AEX85619.1 histidine kinase [Marinitoga piezophila KA3]